MNKYKYSRKEAVKQINDLTENGLVYRDEVESILLSKPELDKIKCPCGKEAQMFGVCSSECAHKYLDPKPPIFKITNFEISENNIHASGGSGSSQPESDKDKCDHDHLCCPGDIRTVRCAYCGKSMYHEPQEELEVDELGKGNWEYRFNGTEEWMTLGNNLTEITDKLNSLIKAHNALVKEVKNK